MVEEGGGGGGGEGEGEGEEDGWVVSSDVSISSDGGTWAMSSSGVKAGR